MPVWPKLVFKNPPGQIVQSTYLRVVAEEIPLGETRNSPGNTSNERDENSKRQRHSIATKGEGRRQQQNNHGWPD